MATPVVTTTVTPAAGSGGVTAGAMVAWGVLFVIFIAMTDVPALQPVGAGLAWLLFVSILMKYGPAAFATITKVNTGSTALVQQTQNVRER